MFTVFRVLGLLLRSAAAAGHHKFYKQSLLAQHYMHTTTRNALWCCLVHLSSHHSLRHPDRSTTPTNKCSWNILSAKIWTWQWVMILTTIDEWVYNNWNGSNEYKQKKFKIIQAVCCPGRTAIVTKFFLVAIGLFSSCCHFNLIALA